MFVMQPILSRGFTSVTNEYGLSRKHSQTWQTLQHLANDVEAFRLKEGDLPATFKDLPPSEDSSGNPVERLEIDGWGRPIVYYKMPTAFVVYSYGADGIAEGQGLDADIIFMMRQMAPLRPPTFRQYLDSGVCWAPCTVAAGLMALATFFHLLRPSRKTNASNALNVLSEEVTERKRQNALLQSIFALVIAALVATTGVGFIALSVLRGA
jgi:hypothetical protein